MDFDEYLWRNKIKITHFAKKLNVTATTVHQLKKRATTPNLLLALKLLKLADFSIPIENLLSEFDQMKYQDFLESLDV